MTKALVGFALLAACSSASSSSSSIDAGRDAGMVDVAAAPDLAPALDVVPDGPSASDAAADATAGPDAAVDTMKLDAPLALLPADYQTSFVTVRGCRSSIDHDLANVVVRVRADLSSVYDKGPFPFPTGALVVLEQYSDSGCKSLSGYAAMRKEASGYFPTGGDWQYFTLDPTGIVNASGRNAGCAACHAGCGAARDGTCAAP